MNVTLQYAGQARDVAGTASESMPGTSSVSALVLAAAARHPKLAPLLLKADGTPHPSLLVVVGDEQVRLDDPRPLREGDVITLMTPISGG